MLWWHVCGVCVMDITLADAKKQIRDNLVAGSSGDAHGIVGVGIDPTENSGQGSLVVFYSDQYVAEDSIDSLLGKSKIQIDLRPGKFPLDFALPEEVGSHALKNLFTNLTAPTLSPSMSICQQGQRSGRLGCFVKLADNSIFALTLRHMFAPPPSPPPPSVLLDVYSCVNNAPLRVIGDSLKLSVIGLVNSAECAMFKPSAGATLQRDSQISGNFIKTREDLVAISGKKVKCLSSGRSGIVVDADAIIKYSLPPDTGDRVLFVSQVLVKNAEPAPLGSDGESGSLVVLGEATDSFQINDAVGLYAWTSNTQQYHFVTPFYACASKLGIASIFNPP